ncbi:hypothetical protein [Glutamicibacter sp. V16R2B1]|uniref:hypothetical protein n=1 Tax=Glutamicibacter sp. V16R2B1 TaxID=2036207 RepID=UPI0010FE4E0B|nr:hypothetical protein [Glutamicibacter sp. V16R2B1]MCK9901221.1 hypothetical protein [Frankia sp. Cpl3]TLK47509.1 hypothetical protein FDN03_15745 [Glutamicibacter sp. V16R2B1]
MSELDEGAIERTIRLTTARREAANLRANLDRARRRTLEIAEEMEADHARTAWKCTLLQIALKRIRRKDDATSNDVAAVDLGWLEQMTGSSDYEQIIAAAALAETERADRADTRPPSRFSAALSDDAVDAAIATATGYVGDYTISPEARQRARRLFDAMAAEMGAGQ